MSENAVWFVCKTCDDKIRSAKYWVRDNRWAVSADMQTMARFFGQHAGWDHNVVVSIECAFDGYHQGRADVNAGPSKAQKDSALDTLLRRYEVASDERGNIWIVEDEP